MSRPADSFAQSLFSLILPVPELKAAVKINDVGRSDSIFAVMTAETIAAADGVRRPYQVKVFRTPIDQLNDSEQQLWLRKINAGVQDSTVISHGRLSIPSSSATLCSSWTSYFFFMTAITARESTAMAALPWPSASNSQTAPDTKRPVSQPASASTSVPASSSSALNVRASSTLSATLPSSFLSRATSSSISSDCVGPSIEQYGEDFELDDDLSVYSSSRPACSPIRSASSSSEPVKQENPIPLENGISQSSESKPAGIASLFTSRPRPKVQLSESVLADFRHIAPPPHFHPFVSPVASTSMSSSFASALAPSSHSTLTACLSTLLCRSLHLRGHCLHAEHHRHPFRQLVRLAPVTTPLPCEPFVLEGSCQRNSSSLSAPVAASATSINSNTPTMPSTIPSTMPSLAASPSLLTSAPVLVHSQSSQSVSSYMALFSQPASLSLPACAFEHWTALEQAFALRSGVVPLTLAACAELDKVYPLASTSASSTPCSATTGGSQTTTAASASAVQLPKTLDELRSRVPRVLWLQLEQVLHRGSRCSQTKREPTSEQQQPQQSTTNDMDVSAPTGGVAPTNPAVKSEEGAVKSEDVMDDSAPTTVKVKSEPVDVELVDAKPSTSSSSSSSAVVKTEVADNGDVDENGVFHNESGGSVFCWSHLRAIEAETAPRLASLTFAQWQRLLDQLAEITSWPQQHRFSDSSSSLLSTDDATSTSAGPQLLLREVQRASHSHPLPVPWSEAIASSYSLPLQAIPSITTPAAAATVSVSASSSSSSSLSLSASSLTFAPPPADFPIYNTLGAKYIYFFLQLGGWRLFRPDPAINPLTTETVDALEAVSMDRLSIAPRIWSQYSSKASSESSKGPFLQLLLALQSLSKEEIRLHMQQLQQSASASVSFSSLLRTSSSASTPSLSRSSSSRHDYYSRPSSSSTSSSSSSYASSPASSYRSESSASSSSFDRRYDRDRDNYRGRDGGYGTTRDDRSSSSSSSAYYVPSSRDYHRDAASAPYRDGQRGSSSASSRSPSPPPLSSSSRSGWPSSSSPRSSSASPPGSPRASTSSSSRSSSSFSPTHPSAAAAFSTSRRSYSRSPSRSMSPSSALPPSADATTSASSSSSSTATSDALSRSRSRSFSRSRSRSRSRSPKSGSRSQSRSRSPSSRLSSSTSPNPPSSSSSSSSHYSSSTSSTSSGRRLDDRERDRDRQAQQGYSASSSSRSGGADYRDYRDRSDREYSQRDGGSSGSTGSFRDSRRDARDTRDSRGGSGSSGGSSGSGRDKDRTYDDNIARSNPDDDMTCNHLHNEMQCHVRAHRHVWASIVNPLPCTATQICFFYSRGECRNGTSSSGGTARGGSCRFYHWTAREKYLFERTGVLPFYAGAGDAFGAQPASLHELLYKLPRTLRERIDTLTRPPRHGQGGAFTERDFNDPTVLAAIAALSVSEAFDMCTRLDQIKARPESPVDALLQEIRDARIRLPQPADGTHLDKESLSAKYLSVMMKFSGWRTFRSDDFDREVLRTLGDLPAEKLDGFATTLKTPRFADWPRNQRAELLIEIFRELATAQ